MIFKNKRKEETKTFAQSWLRFYSVFVATKIKIYLQSAMKIVTGGIGCLLLPLTFEPLVLQIDRVLPPDDDHVQSRVQVRRAANQTADKVWLTFPGNVDESYPVWAKLEVGDEVSHQLTALVLALAVVVGDENDTEAFSDFGTFGWKKVRIIIKYSKTWMWPKWKPIDFFTNPNGDRNEKRKVNKL